MEEDRVTKAEASEVWTEKAAAEPAVPASAKSDGNSDWPSPAPWVTPIPARCIIRVIPFADSLLEERVYCELVAEKGNSPGFYEDVVVGQRRCRESCDHLRYAELDFNQIGSRSTEAFTPPKH
jgi:hypothetical protein